MLISAIVRDENEAMEVAIGSVFPAMLLSGIIWPVEGMPDWVQFISNFSPLTHNAEAIRSVASRGKTFMLKICWKLKIKLKIKSQIKKKQIKNLILYFV